MCFLYPFCGQTNLSLLAYFSWPDPAACNQTGEFMMNKSSSTDPDTPWQHGINFNLRMEDNGAPSLQQKAEGKGLKMTGTGVGHTLPTLDRIVNVSSKNLMVKM